MNGGGGGGGGSSSVGMISCAPADGRWKPAAEAEAAAAAAAPNCPRCCSSNTKFCYYNNYSLSQPRYFCKGCRRYWTKGGSLRNVPVGGGCRKTRRGKSLRLSAPPSAARRPSPPQTAPCPDLKDDSSAAIDLELLYAKYLNPAAAAPEAAASSESSCGGQIPLQIPSGQQLPLECQSASVAHPPSTEETLAMSQINECMLYDFSGDLSCSLALQPAPAPEINFDEFESFPILTAACVQKHQQGLNLVVEEDEWSSLDYSTLEAFYRY